MNGEKEKKLELWESPEGLEFYLCPDCHAPIMEETSPYCHLCGHKFTAGEVSTMNYHG